MQNRGDTAATSNGGPTGFPGAIRWTAALGLFLRLYHYGRNPSMWHDEAATSVNVLRKSFAGLLGHLDHSATGPPLFLWLQKCVALLLGDSTWSLRLISVLASCLGLLLFVKLSKVLLKPPAAFCATLLVACSDYLLWHASEARHYSGDFLCGVVLLLLFTQTRHLPVTKRMAWFALFAPLVILFSYPGIFLCGGLMLALLIDVRKEGRVRAWTGWLLLGALIAATFAFFYFVTIRAQRSGAMDAAWANKFPNWHEWRKLPPVWAVIETVGIFDYFARPYAGGILIVPAAAGLLCFWREKKRALPVLILAPMGFAMLAALVKSYPYTGARTMVYCLPGLGILIGAGMSPTIRWLKARSPKYVASILICSLWFPFGGALVLSLYRVAVPWKRADTAGASNYVLTHRRPDDPVTANHWEYEYYFRNLKGAFSPDVNLSRNPAITKSNRAWLVLTSGKKEERLRLASGIIGSGWRVIEQRAFQNTTVFLLSRIARN